MNPEAVLFDFDGVIADTISDLCKTWQKSFKDFNIDIKLEDYPPLEGMKMIEIARAIGKKYGKELDDEHCLQIKKLKDKYYLEDFKFKFFPEIHEIIDFLIKNKKKLAIVSASPKEKLEKTVPKEFLEKFDVIIAAEDTEKGKPYPDPYLEATKKLGLRPEQCLVIENAPLGIQSAKSAGIFCIVLETTLDKEFLKSADIIFRNHSELMDFFLTDSILKYSL